jgi:phosphoserine aminotransferase
MKEAQLFGEVVEIASSKDQNFNYIPDNYTVPSDLDYLHLTTNNTIFGTQFKEIPRYPGAISGRHEFRYFFENMGLFKV